MNKGKTRIICILILLNLTSASAFSGDYVLVVNSESQVSTISKEDAKNIFLGNKLYWTNGTRIYAARLGDGTLTQDFLNEVVGMDITSFNTHWRRRLFSGKAIPPKKFDTDAQIMEYVSSSPGALGYVSKTEIGKSSKIKEVKVE